MSPLFSNLLVLALVHLATAHRLSQASKGITRHCGPQCHPVLLSGKHTHPHVVYEASVKVRAAFNVLIKSHNSLSAQSAELLICRSSQQVHVRGLSQLKQA